ncbi:MAG: asparagine--tRNA ligase, partial [Desulfuromonas sp.]
MKLKKLLTADAPLQDVEVRGWVRTLRASKEVCFIELNDGSCFASLQLVADRTVENFAELSHIGTGACIKAVGNLIDSPAKGQRWELHVKELTVVGNADPSYPLQKKRHSFEYLRTIAHLRPRSNTFGAVFRLRNALSYAVHQFFQQRDFLYVHTPIITASDCEGAGELFRVTTLDPANPPKTAGHIDWQKDFFGARTGLTVSGQLQGELFATAFSDIYTFGPTFRAENSNTSRHASEFWMIEPEIAFANLADDCQLAEDFLRFLVKYALEHCAEDLQFFNDRIEKGLLDKLTALADATFSTMTYSEAIEQLKNSGQNFEFPVEWGLDLQSEHERYLCEQVVNGPLFVTDYPKEIKAFYMRANE